MVAEPGERVGLGGHEELLVDLGVLQGDGGMVGEELHQLELLGLERAADAVQVQRADGAGRAVERGDDDGLLLVLRRAGHMPDARVAVGVVDQLGLAAHDDGPGDALAQGETRLEDLVGVLVAGEHRHELAGRLVDEVDGEGVVGHDLGQGVGHGRQRLVVVAGLQQALGDGQQLVLVGQLAFQPIAPPLQLLHLARVDDGDGGLRPQDLGQAQLTRLERVEAQAGDLQHALDLLLEPQGHDDHGFVALGRAGDVDRPRVGHDVADDLRLAGQRRCMPPSPSPRTSRVVSAVSSAYSGTLVLRVTASRVRPSGSST